MPRVTCDELTALARRALEGAGANQAMAESTARALVAAANTVMATKDTSRRKATPNRARLRGPTFIG